jgi:hypothetical protein
VRPRHSAAIAAAILLCAACGCRKPDPQPRLPATVLWIWERPEDLAFADPRETGFAVLAGTVTLLERDFSWRPRLQPVALPTGAVTLAVVRIEAPGSRAVEPGAQAQIRLADLLARIARDTRAEGLQVDFDARQSERALYRRLLEQIRPRLAPGQTLSITALASWCAGDSWIRDLPVVEAVPMLFRMGVEQFSGSDLRVPLCATSAGVSTDEPFPALSGRSRIYVFSARGWTRQEVAAAMTASRSLR